MTKRKKPAVQWHHITYEPEVKVLLWRGEHWVMTQLNRRKRISKAFLRCLRRWIRENKQYARKLDKPV